MKNVAVVGLGYWGPNIVRNVLSLPDAHLYALCDSNEDQFRSRRLPPLPPSTKCISQLEVLLDDPALDAVVLATPISTHYALGKRCLEAGKHLLIEKPFTQTGEQALELTHLAEDKKRVLAVGHTFLYTSAVQQMKALIDKGEIGEIRHIHIQRLNLGQFQRDTNVVWDLMPHDLSMILYFMNDQLPSQVLAQGHAHYNPETEDTAWASLSFAKGVSAYLHNSWIDPRKVRTVTVVGDKKMLLFDDTDPNMKLQVYNRGVEESYSSFSGFNAAYRYGDIHIPKVDGGEALGRQLEHFITCIEAGRKPLTDGMNGYRVVKVLTMIQDAIRANKIINYSSGC